VAVTQIGWDSNQGSGDDIHVLWGQKTRTLNDLLFIFTSPGPGFFAKENAKWGGQNITKIEFLPIFSFTKPKHGINVLAGSGQVETERPQ
jgi:hypothetical protein